MKQFRKLINVELFIICLNLAQSIIQGIPKEAFLSDNIVVGRLADLEDFPFIVSVRIKSVHYCAATIVHEKWAITAAECYQNLPLSYYTIISSSQQLTYNTGITHSVSNITLSPDKNIALIKISDKFTETPAIPSERLLGNYELGVILGWGFTATPGTTPKDLRMISLRILESYKCQVAFTNLKVDPSIICTMPKGKLQGICTGDVGSPLTANGKIYGIASWRKNCLDGKPEVFYSLVYLNQWIHNVIQYT